MTKALIMAAILFAAPAGATCTTGGAPLNLRIPALQDSGTAWASCIRESLLKLSTASVVSSTYSSSFMGTLGVRELTGLATGQQMIKFSSSAFSTSSSVYLTWAGSAAFAGANGVGITYGVSAASGVFTSSVQVRAGGVDVATATTSAIHAFYVNPKTGAVSVYDDLTGNCNRDFCVGRKNSSVSSSAQFDTWYGWGGSPQISDPNGSIAASFGATGIVLGNASQPVFIGANAVPANATLTVRSTSTVATEAVLSMQNQSGTELFRFQQNGRLAINGGVPAYEIHVASGSIFSQYGLISSTAAISTVTIANSLAFPNNGVLGSPAIVGSDADSGLMFGGSGANTKTVWYVKDSVLTWGFDGSELQCATGACKLDSQTSLRVYAAAGTLGISTSATAGADNIQLSQDGTKLLLQQNGQGGVAIGTTTSINYSLSISTQGGLQAGLSASTMTPNGTIFYQSSMTITGSTCTVGGATAVSMSTHTLDADVMSKDGDVVRVECVFMNSGTAPTSPQMGITFAPFANGQVGFVSSGVNSALQRVHVRIYVKRVSATLARYWGDSAANTLNGNSTVPAFSDNGNLNGIAFDSRATHVIKCQAQENGGGRVNFLEMTVSKVPL